MNSKLFLACCVGVIAWSIPASAGSPVSALTPSRIDPLLWMYRDALVHHGGERALFGHHQGLDPDFVGVTLRFSRALDARDAGELARIGVALRRLDESGAPMGLGHVYRATIPWKSLELLYGVEGLELVEPAFVPGFARPTTTTSAQVGASQANRLPELGVTGRGVVIADLDSGFDLLHPAFFKPDGPTWAWVDLDGDGQMLGEGSDGLDYDGDGNISSRELLRVLDALTYESSTGMTLGEDDGLQTSRDWIYLDLNNNGRRDAGTPGFDEQTPAYGEPLFVVDDVDGDDVLDPQERLVQLSSSKFASVTVGERTWTRGVDLLQATRSSMVEEAGHGTSVAGILAGGAHPYHVRHGLAPDADLMGFGYDSQSQESWIFSDAVYLASLEQAVERGAQVAIHEWTNPFMRPHDGSTNFEAAMDAASQMGVVQINPMGNLNTAKRHIERDLDVGEPVVLEFDVSNGKQFGNQLYPYYYVYTSLQWTGTQALTLELSSPVGTTQRYDMSAQMAGQGGAFSASIDGTVVQISHQFTTRGNTIVYVILYRTDNSSIGTGRWGMTLTGMTEEATLVGRMGDALSSWDEGVKWVGETEGRGTICFPATADSAIGVGAHAGVNPYPWEGTDVGDLRGYSSRGPRLDGGRGVDITAPDDPYAPMAITPELSQRGFARQWYTTFGGTSGAGPHVAAAAALLIEQDPTRSPEQILELLTTHADEPFAQFEPFDWGAGKLDVYRALYQQEIPAGEDATPIAALEILEDEGALVLSAAASFDPEGQPLQARFDVDHDGAFDSEWGAALEFTLPEGRYMPGDRVMARVDVRDTLGQRHGAIATFEVPFPPAMMDDPEPADMPMSADDMASVDMPADETDISSPPDLGRRDSSVDMPDEEMPAPPESQELVDEGCQVAHTPHMPGPAHVVWLGLLGLLGLRPRRSPRT